MTTSIINRAGRLVLDLVYPPRCALCGRHGVFLCGVCLASLPTADDERCDHCWLPLSGERCRHCAAHPLALEALRSTFRYEGDVRRLVHAFKFGGQSCLAEPLGRLLASTIDEQALRPDAIVPVPLRGSRRRRRGYNQASLLAAETAGLLGLPLLDVLARRGVDQPQALTTTAAQRRANVAGAFEPRCGASGDVEGRSLLLVDDVATTGATLDACARVLLQHGAASVAAATLARED